MPLSEDAVREALKQVIDPELFVNIIDLGLVYTVVVEPAGKKIESGEQQASETSGAVADASAVEPGETTTVAADAPPKENVKIEMTMTSPACPAGPQLIGQSKQVLAALPNVGEVEVKLVMVPPWTPDRMTEEARDQLGIF